MNKYIVTIFNLLLLYSSCLSADESTYQVTIKNCPATLKITIPSDFHVASKPNEIKLRNKILSALNKPYEAQSYAKAKAQYSEIYKVQWATEWPPFPRIQISSLGSVQKAQGNISRRTWNKIKDATINADKNERDRRYKRIQEYFKRHGAEVSTKWLQPYELDENTIILNAIGETTVPGRDKTLKYISGSKLIYVNKCVASVALYMDLETPNVFAVLDNYIAAIDVK